MQRPHMICALPLAAARNALRTSPLRISSRTQKRTMVAGMSASWGYKDMPSQEGKTFLVTVSCNCCVCATCGSLAPWHAIGDPAVAVSYCFLSTNNALTQHAPHCALLWLDVQGANAGVATLRAHIAVPLLMTSLSWTLPQKLTLPCAALTHSPLAQALALSPQKSWRRKVAVW